MKYLPQATRDNETFLKCLCLYTGPEVFHKALNEVQTRRAKLIDRGIMLMVQGLFKEGSEMSANYIGQVHFWQIVNAHNVKEFKTDDSLIKSVIYVISSNLQRLRFDKSVSKSYAPTFSGLSQFIRLYILGLNVNFKVSIIEN